MHVHHTFATIREVNTLIRLHPLHLAPAKPKPPCFIEMRTPANPNAHSRRRAYLDMMERFALEPQVISVDGEGWEFEEIGRQGGFRIIAQKALNTNTVLCSNDRLAIGFLSACYESGVQVGRDAGADLRVASHDNNPFSRFTCPSLTTAAHDFAAVSQTAVDTVFQVIEAGGHLENRKETLFPASLVIRNSA